ncbi:serine hydrolase domain-containing protein [Erythrobacter sp. EC-HK427]|uniref:serine hydrolase domain-containing protein n=1 Tax=Erythrobacter sp. EC-HK427 TaxID=2038396 RepID=UPI00125A4A30|nr:serine hydrolase domain-containing protein [Erythrobacter sp. EC-HK427]VVT11850.1 Serine hydrolase [Erythrobacter sp. EC-HK427]
MNLPRTLPLAALLAAALAGCATPNLGSFETQDADARAYAVLVESGFAGDAAFSVPGKPDTIYYGPTEPEEAATRTVEGWPWASVTKQVIAVLVMREVEEGTFSLGSDVGQFVPRLRGREISVEDLLRHRSGLPNPDDTAPDANGFPSFYTSSGDPLAFCTGRGEAPAEGSWVYNNCDYVVLGALLEAATDSSLDLLLAQGVGLDSGWINTGFFERGSERQFAARTDLAASRIAGYGAAASLVGPLDDMLAFDRALMDGTLLGAEWRERLWEGDPALGYMALGQWSFEVPLAGCDMPVRIIERRGGIAEYQVRNVILPDLGIAVAIATDQPDFDFGEIWTGAGPMHDTLAELACR